jgi:threonine dehydratase
LIFATKVPVSMRKPTRQGVLEAAAEVSKVVPLTSLRPIEINGNRIWCKCESEQPIGAFKLRGAWHRLTALSESERKAGVVAFSSGNHAQGVAWAAQRLGIAATIVMPSDAPNIKVDGTRKLGADIVFYDRMTEDRIAIANALAAERNATVVPAYDDPWVVEGQGSAGIEIAEQLAALGEMPAHHVVTCCGGGGLAAGLAIALPDAHITVVEPDGWDDMGESLRLGYIVPVGPNPPKTACDAIQTLKTADITFDILKARKASAVSVSDAEVGAAMKLAYRQLGLIIEPGGAVALAAVMAGKVPVTGQMVVILSGGNVDPELFQQMIGA